MILVDTVAAISTAPGTGAIAIIRLTGSDSWKIARRLFVPRTTKPDVLDEWISGKARHGYAKDMHTERHLDEIVLIPYKGPNTFTGEDLIEINCHGGLVVTREILDLCLAHGARLARQGEFTQRAFLNGRLDLVQAEAIHDLISAKTTRQSRLAVSALKGDLGRSIHEARKVLITLLTRVNAGIDFPEEVGDVPLNDINSDVLLVRGKLEKLAATTRSGKYLRDGLRLSIVGKPNVGKSSLLNQLLNFERAIVTDVPGTTRDSLEELFDINGIPIILTDTAGIRETTDVVEQIGIERSRAAVESSDLVLFVCDLNSPWTETDQLIIEMIGEKPFVTLGNKMDLTHLISFTPAESVAAAEPERDDRNWALYDIANTVARKKPISISEPARQVTTIERAPDPLVDTVSALAHLPISAKTGENLNVLTDWIESWALQEQNLEETGGSLNLRQGELCLKTIASLDLVLETLENEMPQDCLATDLKNAIDNLSEVCGEVVSEEVITNIFATFCIGK